MTGVGLVLIAIGLASVVSDLPTEADPTPAAGPLPITFGRALDPDTYLVTDATNRFEPGDPFAYSVNPPVHPGVPNVYVAIITFRAGSEVVLQPPSPQRLLPEPVSFGYETTTVGPDRAVRLWTVHDEDLPRSRRRGVRPGAIRGRGAGPAAVAPAPNAGDNKGTGELCPFPDPSSPVLSEPVRHTAGAHTGSFENQPNAARTCRVNS